MASIIVKLFHTARLSILQTLLMSGLSATKDGLLGSWVSWNEELDREGQRAAETGTVYREKYIAKGVARKLRSSIWGSAPEAGGLDVCHIAGAFGLICMVCASCVLCSSTNSLVHHNLISILNLYPGK